MMRLFSSPVCNSLEILLTFVSNFSTPGAEPTSTTISNLAPSAMEYTSYFIGPEYITEVIGVPGAFAITTSTQTLPPGSPSSTSIIIGASTITYVIGSPAAYASATQTVTIPPGSAISTSTATGVSTVTILIYSPGVLQQRRFRACFPPDLVDTRAITHIRRKSPKSKHLLGPHQLQLHS